MNVTPYQSTDVNCKAILLCFTCDLPAKAAVHNCVQFNGFYGCPRCMHQGRDWNDFNMYTISNTCETIVCN